MTVDHLPQSHVDLAEPVEHADETPATETVNGTKARAKQSAEPTPEPSAEVDENWHQSGFGSFP